MATITDLAKTWLRPFVTDGVSASGINNPSKPEGIAVLTAVDTKFTAVDAQFDVVAEQIDAVLEEVEAGGDPTFSFDASTEIGTTTVDLLPPDDSRVALTMINVGTNGGTITFTTNGDEPIPGVAGTIPLTPGAGVTWSSLDAPQGAVKAIANAAGTQLTAQYSSRAYNPPGLLRTLAAFTTPAADARETLMRNLWKSLADANFDIANMAHFMAVNATEQASLINWPDASLMVNHGATYLADMYFQGDGSTAYIDTLVNLTAKGYSQNNAFMSCWVLGTATGFLTAMGSGRGSIQPNRSSTAFGVRANMASHDTHTTGVHVGGHFAWTRTDSGSYRAYFNGAPIDAPSAIASDGSPINTLYLLARNFGGINEPSSMKILGSAAGSAPAGDPDAAIETLYQSWSTYFTALGSI